jgi:methionyl-tRNA formyltransferase
MRVVFAGTPEVALPALDAIAQSRHELVAVVTRPDAPAGRGRQLVASPVAVRGEELGVPVLKPDHPRDPDFQEALAALRPDCCPVVAYGALLPQSALDIPAHGWVNLHFSVLPHWRGAAPVQHAILAGDEVTGATTFRIVQELDAGPTYGLMTQTIGPEDTAGSLLAKLAEGGAGLLVATLDGIEDGTLEERAQPEDGVSYAPKVLVEHAQVDWTDPALAIDRQIRACTPAPGAWTTFDGERMKLGPLTLIDRDPIAPGVLEVTKNAVFVGTATQPVRLGEVKAFGKKVMPAADWARGVRVEPGTRLGSLTSGSMPTPPGSLGA